MNRAAGYSVFDVLVAFAIMSLVLAALLPGQAKLLSRASETDNVLLAQDFALSRLAELRALEPVPGQAAQMFGEWTLTERITRKMSNTTLGVDVFDVTIVVSDASGAELARVEVQMVPTE